jgi:hypothetical protein
MLVVYLLIAPSLRNSRAAIAVLDRPSAISSSTDRSRSVSAAIGSSLRRAGLPSSFAITAGSRAVPPPATRPSASMNSAASITRSLSR